MSQETVDYKRLFHKHKVIESESKSWFVGKPGTTQHAYSVTWSPGALLLYGVIGSISFISNNFSSYIKTKNWMRDCTIDEFKGAISNGTPEDLEYFYEALKYWGSEPHYK